MSDLTLYATIQEALRLQAQMPDSARAAFLEKTVRGCWPFTREWFYSCETCRDFGWEYLSCPGDRPFCGRGTPHLEHTYVRPCTCAAGIRKREPERTEETDVQAAAKRRPLTRWGR